MASEDPPLDEIQWRSPQLVQQLGGIQTNTVLPYFAESPFFDRTSNNATLTNQALYNQSMYHLVQTREAFEGHLRSMAGMEFMVVYDPTLDGTVVEHSGVWVIRKQNRRKKSGMEDEVTPISSYFVVGENIYMAPSIKSVLSSRLLSTITSLTKLLSVSSKLPIFNPALGHIYTPPSATSTITSVMATQATQATQVTQATPEGTQNVETQTSSMRSKTSFALTEKKETLADHLDANFLAESLRLSQRYGNEYMDESPLMGEPGSFIIKRPKEPPTVPASSQNRNSATPVPATKPSSSTTPLPPPLKTDLPPDVSKKLKGAEKSPITPSGSKKKRKSKVQTPKTPK